jgi:hypothetical protein
MMLAGTDSSRETVVDLEQISARGLLDRIRCRLQDSPDATKTLLALTALNLSVFLAWKTPFRPIHSLLQRLFVSRPNSHFVLPHLFSSFSHISGTEMPRSSIQAPVHIFTCCRRHPPCS